jgi:hypothetical protein
LRSNGSLEFSHPFLIHGLLVVAAWLTYFVDRDDIVWRSIRGSTHPRLLEHIGFALAAAAIGAGILLGSWRTDKDSTSAGWTVASIHRRSLGEILHGIGIAALMPLPGFLLLATGETIRSLRYARLKMRTAQASPGPPAFPVSRRTPYQRLVLSQGFAWCAFASMLVFSVLLVDRVANYLFLATMILAVVTRAMLP